MPEMTMKYEYHGRAINPSLRTQLQKQMDDLATARQAAREAMLRAADSITARREAAERREAQRAALRGAAMADRQKGFH